MSHSKKDYVAIAEISLRVQENAKGKYDQQVGAEELIRRIAEYFTQTNSRFDRERFLKAAGVER